MEAVPEPRDSDSLKSFFTEYMDETGSYIYKEQIEALITRGNKSIIIDFDDLLRFNDELARNLLKNPDPFIQLFETDFVDIIESIDPEYAAKVKQFHVRFRNVPEKVMLRDIRAEHLGKLITSEGILTRSTEIKPLLIEAIFRCNHCGTLMQKTLKEGRYQPPEQCENLECGRKGGILFLADESMFIDWQRVTIQEKPEELPPGRMPQSISLILYDDLVDIARPGDRIKVVGILRSRPESTLKPGKLATFYRYIDCNFIDRVESELEKLEITAAEEVKIQELGKDLFIAQKVVNSIAPSIFGYDHIKEALALLLFGGVTKYLPDNTTIRGDPNILMIGDPGTGKSQMLKYIAGLAPRGLYTSGKGSTAAGLCVSADSDIFFSDGIDKIGGIIEDELKEGSLEKYNGLMEFKRNQANNRQILHSSNLKLQSQKISKFWRIKSPSTLQRIVSKTGKEIKLTAETSVFSITEKDGLVWIPAKLLKPGDHIASMRKFPETTSKEIPTIFDLIKDYPGRITLLKMEAIVKEIIEKIRSKKDLSLTKISHKLNVSISALGTWFNEQLPGNISLRNFIALCELIGENAEHQLPANLHLQIKNGQTIVLPRQLDEDWFYIMGLIVGDGRISIDRRESGYSGVTIGLANRNDEILNNFRTFFLNLGFNVSITEGSDKRAAEYRIWSKLMYYFFAKFGLCSSPKSTNISPNTDILFFEERYLNSFLKGIYDSDGWIYVRPEGSSHIGFASTSKELINFVQYGLLRSGIISYIRERQPKVTVTASGKKIIAKHVRYELTFANYNAIHTFKEKIGFNHPDKQAILEKYCQQTKGHHRNDDNIPGITLLLKEIVDFYHYTSRELVGYKTFFTPSSRKDSISHLQLKSILEKIDPNWHRVRVKIPYETRNIFYNELQKKYSTEQIEKMTKTSKTQLYEYFIRKGRNPAIPISIIIKLFNSEKVQFKSAIKKYITNLIKDVQVRHEFYSNKYELLQRLCLSDIFWDEIAFIEEIESDKPYVYDLTIPNSHNFIVNGFVVHNTAAVIKDPQTGELNLEAGALVLSDKGVACLHPKTNVIFNDQITPIESLFNEHSKEKAITGNEEIEICPLNGYVKTFDLDNLISIEDRSSLLRRKKYTGKLIKVQLDSGFELQLTPDHKLIDGNTLQWRRISEFKVGNFLVAPLKLSSPTAPIYIFDIIPDDWLVILSDEDKIALKERILNEFKSISEFNRFFGITKRILTGREHFTLKKLKIVLEHLNLASEWKTKPLKYGRKRSGQILKISQITPELAYFIGFVYGDGSYSVTKRRSHLSIVQSSKNQEIIQHLKKIMSTISFAPLNEYYRTQNSEIRGKPVTSRSAMLYHNSNLLTYLTDYFLKEGLKNILKLPQESLKGFIAGALDADGCISIKKGIKNQKTYETAHIEFLLSNNDNQDLAFILALRRLDVYAKLKKKAKVNIIRMTGRDDVKQLCNFLKKYSIKAMTTEIPENKHKVSSTSEKLPKQPVSEICEQISQGNTSFLIQKGIWSTIYAYTTQRYQPSRIQLRKIRDRLEQDISPSILNNINNLIKRDYFLDKIISISQEEYNGYVYDLYVPNSHNFIGNGVWLHNCIDEFDKMRPEDRVSIHEAMEQHTISIAKAGIVATLNARTSIVAAANPAFGRYNPYKDPADNIKLPTTVLSRFDLIFILQDKPDPTEDRQKARHILKLHEQRQTVEPPIPADLLRKYIAYAKQHIHPTMTTEAAERIEEFYVDMRKTDQPDSPIAITPRQLEGLIRLAEARARMRLSQEATEEDADTAIRLVNNSLKEVGMDTETGKIDALTLMTGRSQKSRSIMERVMDIVRELSTEAENNNVKVEDVINRAIEEGMNEVQVRDTIQRLKNDGNLYEPRMGYLSYA